MGRLQMIKLILKQEPKKMQDNEIIEINIVEMILLKKEEIHNIHNKLLYQMSIKIDDNQKDKNMDRIYVMLNIIADNITLDGKRLILPNWETCRRYEINNYICLDGNFGGESYLFQCFDSEYAARNCFEFVLNALKDIIKEYEIILK